MRPPKGIVFVTHSVESCGNTRGSGTTEAGLEVIKEQEILIRKRGDGRRCEICPHRRASSRTLCSRIDNDKPTDPGKRLRPTNLYLHLVPGEMGGLYAVGATNNITQLTVWVFCPCSVGATGRSGFRTRTANQESSHWVCCASRRFPGLKYR